MTRYTPESEKAQPKWPPSHRLTPCLTVRMYSSRAWSWLPMFCWKSTMSSHGQVNACQSLAWPLQHGYVHHSSNIAMAVYWWKLCSPLKHKQWVKGAPLSVHNYSQLKTSGSVWTLFLNCRSKYLPVTHLSFTWKGLYIPLHLLLPTLSI